MSRLLQSCPWFIFSLEFSRCRFTCGPSYLFHLRFFELLQSKFDFVCFHLGLDFLLIGKIHMVLIHVMTNNLHSHLFPYGLWRTFRSTCWGSGDGPDDLRSSPILKIHYSLHAAPNSCLLSLGFHANHEVTASAWWDMHTSTDCQTTTSQHTTQNQHNQHKNMVGVVSFGQSHLSSRC